MDAKVCTDSQSDFNRNVFARHRPGPLEATIDRIKIAPPRTLMSSVAIFMLPALALTTNVSVGLIEVGLLLASLCYARPLLRQYRERPALFAQSRLVVGALLFNLVVALISLLATGFDARFIENPSKMLLAALATALILLMQPNPRAFWLGLFTGATGAAAFAVHQRFFLMMPRAEGFSMPITFGDLAMAMGLMSLAGVQPFAKTRLAALPYIAFVAGVVASILSGSRGGWLALLLSFVPLYSYGRDALGNRTIVIIVTSIGLLGAASVVPQTGVLDRVLDVSKEIHQYHNGNPDSSVGARFEMWKGAWTLFVEHPVSGVGRANYNKGLQILIARGDINPAMRDYHHAHNEMLNALATQGLLGAIALVGLYVAPLAFFTRQLRHPGSHRQYALAGIMLILSFIDFGLTQVMFAHHVGSGFYVLTVCTLIGLCLQERQIAAASSGVGAEVSAPAPQFPALSD
ncbi:MAG: O-antigen ligase [Burkholderiaceae bacterium]